MHDPTSPLAPGALDPAASYRITLARPAMAAGIKLKPRGEITLRGDLLRTLIEESADVVLTAEPV